MTVIPCPLFGKSGDSINELQLVEAISRRVERIIVFALTDVREFKMRNNLLRSPDITLRKFLNIYK